MSEPFQWAPPAKRGERSLQHPVSRALRAIGGVFPVLMEEAAGRKQNFLRAVVTGEVFHSRIRAQWTNKSLHSANCKVNDND